METREETYDRLCWERREREAYLDRVRCAHPADLSTCPCCDGSGEVPREYDSRECRFCLGTGLVLSGPDSTLLTEAEWDAHVRDCSRWIAETTPPVSDAHCGFCLADAPGVCSACRARLSGDVR